MGNMYLLSIVLVSLLAFSATVHASSYTFNPSSQLPRRTNPESTTIWGTSPTTAKQYNYQERTFTDFATRDSRLGFIRKVFTIFNVQVIVTIGIVSSILNNPSLANTLLRNRNAVSTITGLGSIAVVFLLCRSQSLRYEAPMNFILLGIHTVLQSIGLGLFASFFNPKQVLIGAMHTLFAFTAITLYSFQPNVNYDLNILGNILLTASIATIGGALMNQFMNIPLMDNVLCGVGAILASSYIFHDTKMIVGGKHATKKYGQKEFILAAMNIYQDAVNLFIHIMKILAKLEQREEREKQRRGRR